MIRVLTFDESDVSKRRFRRLYEGFLSGADTQRRGIETMRREARILDKLDAISDVDAAAKAAGDAPRLLKTGGQRLELDQPEFALVTTHIEQTAWIPAVSREIVDLVDWMATAEAVG